LIEARLGSPRGIAPVRFFDEGAVNYPRASEGLWFITQYRRWGMLASESDDAAVAAAVNQTALYREAADASGVPIPAEGQAAIFCDGRVWDGSDAVGYVVGFDVRA
jgi:nitrate/nitrite transport system substrate-binding protein